MEILVLIVTLIVTPVVFVLLVVVLVVAVVVTLILVLFVLLFVLLVLLLVLAAIVTLLLLRVVPLTGSLDAGRLRPPRDGGRQRPAGLRPGRQWIEARHCPPGAADG